MKTIESAAVQHLGICCYLQGCYKIIFSQIPGRMHLRVCTPTQPAACDSELKTRRIGRTFGVVPETEDPILLFGKLDFQQCTTVHLCAVFPFPLCLLCKSNSFYQSARSTSHPDKATRQIPTRKTHWSALRSKVVTYSSSSSSSSSSSAPSSSSSSFSFFSL